MCCAGLSAQWLTLTCTACNSTCWPTGAGGADDRVPLGDNAAIRRGQHGVVSVEQIALLAPRTNKIHINSEPATVRKSREKKRSPNFSAAGCLAKAPTTSIAHLSHFRPLCLYSSGPCLVLQQTRHDGAGLSRPDSLAGFVRNCRMHDLHYRDCIRHATPLHSLVWNSQPARLSLPCADTKESRGRAAEGANHAVRKQNHTATREPTQGRSVYLYKHASSSSSCSCRPASQPSSNPCLLTDQLT